MKPELAPIWTDEALPDLKLRESAPAVKRTGRAKPAVILPGSRVTISEAAENLFGLIAPTRTLFLRGKAVVALIHDSEGCLVLEPLRPSAARSLFERYAGFMAWRKGANNEDVLKPMVMPEEMAKALLDCYVAREVLPVINGLVGCPIITEVDGQLEIVGEGYHDTTGLLITGGAQPEDVPLTTAVEALKSLLADFHFQTRGDRSRALAAKIAPGLKMGGILKGPVPADVAEADDSQAGKGYRQRMIAALYGEKLALVVLKKGGVGSVDECFFQKLVNGRPFIQFDNFRGFLDSPALEAFFTSDGPFPCRLPYVPEIEVDPRRFFVLLTSNGVETTPDFANRSNIVRIFKRKGAQFPDWLGEIVRRQRFYIGCIFAIISEWHRQGKPRTDDTRHDFREWCQTMDWIVQNLFHEAPLMDGHAAAQERVSNPGLTFLRRLAIAVEQQGELEKPLTAGQLAPIALSAGIQIPGLPPHAAQDEELARKVLGGKLGPLFKNDCVIACDAYTVERKPTWAERDDGKGLRELKSYVFLKTA